MRKRKVFRIKHWVISISVMTGDYSPSRFKLWPFAVWSYPIAATYNQLPGRGFCAHWLRVADFRVEVVH